MLEVLLRFLGLQTLPADTKAPLDEQSLRVCWTRRQFCQTLMNAGFAFAPAIPATLNSSAAYAQQSRGGRPPGVQLLAEGVLGLGYVLRGRASITPIYQVGTQLRLRAQGEIELRGPSYGQGRGDLIMDASSMMLIRGRLEYTDQGIMSSEPRHMTWLMDAESGIIQGNGLEATLPRQAREHHDWVTALMLLRSLPLEEKNVIEACIWTNTEWKNPWTPQIILDNAVLKCCRAQLQGKRAICIDGTLTPNVNGAKSTKRHIKIWISDDAEHQFLRGEVLWLNNMIGINIDTVRGSQWPIQSQPSWKNISVHKP